MNKIQNIILPKIEEITAPSSMYFHGDFVMYSGNDKNKKITLKKFSHLHTNTFFNAFSLDFWQQKTDIEQLSVKLFGQGIAQINIKMESLYFAPQNLHSSVIKFTEEGVTIPIGNLRTLSCTGIIYIELIALSDHVIFHGGEYLTQDAPKRDVHLGIVITHFNRKNYVIPALKRISNHLQEHSYYQNKIKCIVVDNSQNITSEEAQQATIIPNKNLGGSGGFTRGLMYLEDQNTFTHCLFMDDDASCEMESITRAYHAAQFARNEIAISGALLRDNYPDMIHEKGAIFSNASIAPIHHGLGISRPQAVMRSQYKREASNYGAWWFFLFPIKQVKYYAYPFFIRGDDILFSLQNRFDIATLNGVFCWGEDFSLKESPLSRYLGFRGSSICSIIHDKYSAFYVVKLFLKLMLGNVLSYNYDSAQALIKAMEDLQKGPQFIKDNINAANIRKDIAEISATEKMTKINKDIYSIAPPQNHHSKWVCYLKKVLVAITFNGHLLPEILLKNNKQIVHQQKSFRANFSEVFRYQRILYEHAPTGQGYIATINRKKAFTLLWQAMKLSFNFVLNRQELIKDYRNSSIAFTSREFWQKQYEDQ